MDIKINGDVSGHFDLIYISPNTASLPISSYNDYIYNVATLDQNQNVLLYTPSSLNNPFTHFEQQKHYFVFAKKNFTLTVADYTQDKFIIAGNTQGTFSFFKWPFNSSVPLSSFADKFTNLQETTVDGGTITSYQSTRSINSIKTFKKNRIYFIKAVKDFILYNRDIFALKQEQEGDEWILLENGIDRLLLE